MNKLLCALLIGLCLMGTSQAQTPAPIQAQAKRLSEMDPAAKHLRLYRDRFERYQREQQLARPTAAQPLITLPAAADTLGAQDTPAAQPATGSRVGGISVTGDEHLNPSFVLERLQQAPGEVLSIEQLEQDLIRFNALHEPQLSATVSAGAGVLASDVALHVQPAKRHSFSTFVDNAGGMSTVRGFSEGLLSGRSGYALSAELRAVAYAPPPGPLPVVQVLSFFDHGAALPYRPGKSITHDDHLTSAGVGCVVDFSRRVITRVTAAWPIDQNPAERRQRSPRVLSTMSIAWI